MDNKEIIERIKEKGSHRRVVNFEKYLVFKINNNKYAFNTNEVKEIAISEDIFFIPFVPPYIRGFINRYGEPFTVMDINILLENKKIISDKFLVMKIPDDNLCLIITDIIEIIKISEDNIDINKDETNKYFKGIIRYNDSDINIINLKALQDRLENDL